jgi:hypothetical protein
MEGASAFDLVLSVCLGVALAAACGLRVFVPLLVASVAAKLGYLHVSAGMEWLASTPAIVAFAAATLLEIGAYFVPWLDNVLDAAGAPVAVAAGTVLAASALGDVSPLVRWTVAVVAGGGAAGAVHGSLALVRKLSSLTTLGLANPLIAAAEAATALFVAVTAVAMPMLALGILLILIGLALRLGRSVTGHRRPVA